MLAGLGDTAAVAEPFPPIIGDGVHGIIGESTEHEEAGNARPRATLPRVAMAYHYILLVFLQECVHLMADFEKDIHGGRVMVLPLVLLDHVLELFVVVASAGQVENQVAVAVPLLQEGRDVIYVIPVALLEARGREGHPADPRRHIGDVQVVLLRLQAVPLA